MKSFVAVAALAGVAAAGYAPPMYSPPSNASYVTEVLTAYTTYCPGPTSITHGGTTYTVTEATTLTITNCPCTVTYPVSTSVYSSCETCTPASPPPPPPTTPVYTVPANTTVPAPTGSSAAPPPPAATTPVFEGAASAVTASGALAGLLALVAYAL